MARGSEIDVADLLAKATLGSEEANEVSFAGKGLKFDKAEDADEIVKAINECEGLQSLRLEGNTVGVAAALQIAKALERKPGFKRAKWSDMFTGRLRSEIPPSLEGMCGAIITSGAHLVELDLSDNAFGPDGVRACAKLLQSESGYSIQELKFNNNGLGIGGGKILSAALLECHKKSLSAGKPLSLKVFIAGRNRLENEGATALAAAFKAIGTLERVEMPQNGINHPGISALANAFAENSQLKILNLNDNTFTEKGAQAMATAFHKMFKLEMINFGDCLVRSKGAEAIAEALKVGVPKLKELNLSYGEIKIEAAMKLAESIEGKTQLVKLDLNGNYFGDEGIESLRGVLESNGKIESLGSLSDDEGDEDEDDDDEEEEEEEEADEETEGEISQDPVLSIQGTAITPRSPQAEQAAECSLDKFYQLPSATTLRELGENRAKRLADDLGKIDSADSVIKAFLRVSSVMDSDKENDKNIVYDCADAIMSKAHTSGNVAPSDIVNSLLVHLGLLKSEEKIKPVQDITGPLLTLAHVVTQKYFPKSSVGSLIAFLSRAHPRLESSQKARHALLQALYAV
ncbi:ran GTPase-activating protein 1-like [Glandiceps talaboti]